MLNPDQLAAAVRLYDVEKWSLTRTADALGIGRYEVTAAVKAAGVFRDRPDRSEIRREAVRLYRDEGLSFEPIAGRLGSNRGTIRRWVVESGVPLRPTDITPPAVVAELTNDVVKEYRKGRATEAIARRFGVNRVTVRNILIRAGVPLRTRSDAQARRQARRRRRRHRHTWQSSNYRFIRTVKGNAVQARFFFNKHHALGLGIFTVREFGSHEAACKAATRTAKAFASRMAHTPQPHPQDVLDELKQTVHEGRPLIAPHVQLRWVHIDDAGLIWARTGKARYATRLGPFLTTRAAYDAMYAHRYRRSVTGGPLPGGGGNLDGPALAAGGDDGSAPAVLAAP